MFYAQPSLTYLAVINQLTNQPTDHGLLGKLCNLQSPSSEEDKKEDEVSKAGRKEERKEQRTRTD
jgi:hypothetical protein